MLQRQCDERTSKVSAAPWKQTGNHQPGSDFNGTHQERHPYDLALHTMIQGPEKPWLDWELGATWLWRIVQRELEVTETGA